MKCAESDIKIAIKNIINEENSIERITEKIQSFLMDKCTYDTRHHWIVSVGTEDNYAFHHYDYGRTSSNQAIKYIFADINYIKIYMLHVEFSNP